MTALTGLLDGETAAALKGLYGVDNSSTDAPQVESEGADSWDDYEASAPELEFCDSCGEELTEDELQSPAKGGELFCEDCDRRTHSHAVGRFVSTRSRERDFD